MNLLGIRAELEEERTWRREEVRFLMNRLPDLDSDEDQNRYRRAVLLFSTPISRASARPLYLFSCAPSIRNRFRVELSSLHLRRAPVFPL